MEHLMFHFCLEGIFLDCKQTQSIDHRQNLDFCHETHLEILRRAKPQAVKKYY